MTKTAEQKRLKAYLERAKSAFTKSELEALYRKGKK